MTALLPAEITSRRVVAPSGDVWSPDAHPAGWKKI